MAVKTLNSGARIKNDEPGWGLTDEDLTTRYEGAVLGTWEHNGYNDSDFYALVWTGEELKGVEYATTRGWTYANSATVDATPEVKAAAAEWLIERDIAAWNIAAAHDALQIEKGSQVEIVRGRKVPLGTTGTVIWIGPDKYTRGAYRIGVKDADGEVHWTAESNARATDAAGKITSAEEIITTTEARGARLIESGTGWDWVSAYRSYGGNVGRLAVPGKDIDALLSALGRTTLSRSGSKDATDGEAETGATDGSGDAAIKGGSLVALAASIENLEIK
jgi:hypothetical protein